MVRNVLIFLERLGVQGHLTAQFKAKLGLKKPCLKNKTKQWKEINEIYHKKTKKIKETSTVLLEKMDKTDKPLQH